MQRKCITEGCEELALVNKTRCFACRLLQMEKDVLAATSARVKWQLEQKLVAFKQKYGGGKNAKE